MKVLILLPVLLFSFFSYAQELKTTTLADSLSPTHYSKRDKAILNVALGYYGRFWSESDLKRIIPLLEKRFLSSTHGEVGLKVHYTEVLDYRDKIENYPDYTYNQITDKERLQRLWYYDHTSGRILTEVYEEFKKTELGKKNFKNLDALLVVTGAQFDGLGLANGRIAVTEQPREIAWNAPNQGRTDIMSDERVVEELVHELGHIMFLRHTSKQCAKRGMDYSQRLACCETSPSKNDVMSVCRDKEKVDGNFFYKFDKCTMSMIRDLIKPAMLSGGAHKFNEPYICD